MIDATRLKNHFVYTGRPRANIDVDYATRQGHTGVLYVWT